ncbi:cytochrome b5 [Penicillium mononematosum]|uniref:cytochrome b5 n=1 Tax=Penicillium mononematosum TaxID=268346 RepID=UPI0025470720|nr:cytochrome b5 [Penicillium mononematosum]KAJ6190015.1 cytochrome b5 [Penicillium mononematosum]
MSHSPGDPTLTITHSPEEVSKHNHAADMWIIIDREVYDLSQFANEHPGGMKILLSVAGKDATKQFRRYHRDAILNRFKNQLQVGILDTSEKTTKKFFRSRFWALSKRS